MVCRNDDCDKPSLAEVVDHSCSACEDEYAYCVRCVIKRDPRPSKKMEAAVVHIANTARIQHIGEEGE